MNVPVPEPCLLSSCSTMLQKSSQYLLRVLPQVFQCSLRSFSVLQKPKRGNYPNFSHNTLLQQQCCFRWHNQKRFNGDTAVQTVNNEQPRFPYMEKMERRRRIEQEWESKLEERMNSPEVKEIRETLLKLPDRGLVNVNSFFFFIFL